MLGKVRIGDIVTFTYNGLNVHDKFPQVLILHNNWQGTVHGINLNNLSDQEINYVKAVLNPDFAEEISKKDVRIRQQLQRVSNINLLNITSPYDFYLRFIKSFIRQYDSYRRYKPQNMLNIKVITKKEVLTGEEGFGQKTLGSKPKTLGTTTPKSSAFKHYEDTFKHRKG
jgi:hypothetical protein